jgi:Glyoxalase-like domain
VFAFQRVTDFRAPQWPDNAHSQQVHKDVDVSDLDEAHTRVLESGATQLHVDPRGWRVYADPAGHPFCLLQAARTV